MPEDDYYDWDDHNVPMLNQPTLSPPAPRSSSWLVLTAVALVLWLISLGW